MTTNRKEAVETIIRAAGASHPMDGRAVSEMAERAMRAAGYFEGVADGAERAHAELGDELRQRPADAERRLHAERDAVLAAIEGEQPDPSGVWSEAISAAHQLGHQYREAVEHAADLVLEVDALRFDLTDTEALAEARLADIEALATARRDGLREALDLLETIGLGGSVCTECHGTSSWDAGACDQASPEHCRYVALRKLAGMEADDG